MSIEWLSRLDCFHPSAVGHAIFATGLWNTMLCHERKGLCGGGGPAWPPANFTPVCASASSVFYAPP